MDNLKRTWTDGEIVALCADCVNLFQQIDELVSIPDDLRVEVFGVVKVLRGQYQMPQQAIVTPEMISKLQGRM